MRLIAGLARGINLEVPRVDGLRPTADRTRQAVFSALGERVAGAGVLELYAGTGALGLEAGSRGAARLVLVEQDRRVLACLRRNVDAARRQPGWDCIVDVRPGAVDDHLPELAARGERFALIFADPPYGTAAQELLGHPALPGLLTPGGLLVLESADRTPLTIQAPWKLARAAAYGDARVSFLRVQ